jgi:molecular chaperone GrpE
MRKQVEDAKVFGIQNFCKDLLEVSDTLHLAVINTKIDSLDKATNEQDKLRVAKEQVKAIYEGLVLTESKLLKIFEKHGLVKIEPKEGDKFNPNLHEAIFQVPVPNKESGSICTVNQNGYKLQERVIRAAKVGVVQ